MTADSGDSAFNRKVIADAFCLERPISPSRSAVAEDRRSRSGPSRPEARRSRSGEGDRLTARQRYRPADSASLSSPAYRHDANGNIAAIADLLNDANSVLYGYDGMDRLTFGARRRWRDRAGLQLHPRNEQACLGHRAGRNPRRGLRRAGRPSLEARPGGVTVTTAYDGYVHLVSYIRSGTAPLAFTYNGLHERAIITDG